MFPTGVSSGKIRQVLRMRIARQESWLCLAGREPASESGYFLQWTPRSPFRDAFDKPSGGGHTGSMAAGKFPTLDAPPTLGEARALPRTLEASVEPMFIDAMGHMNVAWYVHLFDRATWILFGRLGIDEPYRERARAGMFAVEQHIRYIAELRENDPLHIHSRVLDVQRKSVNLLHVMVDPVRERIAAATEVIGVHVDLTTRRAIPFPEALMPGLRAAS